MTIALAHDTAPLKSQLSPAVETIVMVLELRLDLFPCLSDEPLFQEELSVLTMVGLVLSLSGTSTSSIRKKTDLQETSGSKLSAFSPLLALLIIEILLLRVSSVQGPDVREPWGDDFGDPLPM